MMCKFGSIRFFITYLFRSLLTSEDKPNLLSVGNGFGFARFSKYYQFCKHKLQYMQNCMCIFIVNTHKHPVLFLIIHN